MVSNQLKSFLLTFAFANVINFMEAAYSRKHLEVFFNEPIFPNSNGVNKPEDLIPMLSILSSKFTKISTVITDIQAGNSSNVVMPSAVANYNKFHLKTGESPLQLSISFMMTEEIKNGPVAGPPRNWNSLLQILDKANQIYPGTVKRIYIEHYYVFKTVPWRGGNNENLKNFETYLAHANFELDPKYELGATFDIGVYLYQDLPQLLQHIQHISFEQYPNYFDHQISQQPRHAMERFGKDNFKDCKKKIEEYGKNISLRFETGWTFLKGSDGPKRDKDVVAYSDAVNEWAVKTNSYVAFWKAFDIPEKFNVTKFLDHSGLWRLIPNEDYRRVSDYVFEDKNNELSSAGLLSTLLWTLTGLVVALLFVLSALIIICVFTRQFYPNVLYSHISPRLQNLRLFNFI